MKLYGQFVCKEIQSCLYVIKFKSHEVDFSSGDEIVPTKKKIILRRIFLR